MKQHLHLPACELAAKLRRAAQGGAKLSLTAAHVAVLMDARIYGPISELEAEEIRRTCRAATLNDNDINSAISGCGSAATPALGASAGSNVIPICGFRRDRAHHSGMMAPTIPI